MKPSDYDIEALHGQTDPEMMRAVIRYAADFMETSPEVAKQLVDGVLERLKPAIKDFTPIDAGAVHAAMIDTEHEAKERAEKMPSSSIALSRRAAALKEARDKILDRLPPEFHEHRNAYSGLCT